jgi:hypothetical protein
MDHGRDPSIAGRQADMSSQTAVEGSTSDALFWSRRGQVACGAHAPDVQSERWQIDGWCEIPAEASKRHGLAYQCPRCAPDGRLHRHIHEANGGARPA